MKCFCGKLATALAVAALAGGTARAEYPINYEASITGVASSGDFSPYYINALRHGKITSAHNALLEGKVWREMSTTSRFSYGFGVDFLAGWESGNRYAIYHASEGWSSRSQHPPRIWLQQLFGEVKYRGVYLSAGLKERNSAMLNEHLSSGDLTESGNFRPIPQVRVGFIDFQNIPFTNGWVQIQGEIAYGKMTDSDWWLDRYNYYNYHVTTGEWYNYKRCYFRTKPSQPFSVTLGMQAACTIGGTRYTYSKGELTRAPQKTDMNLKAMWNALLPTPGSGEGFYEGNHLGSWDFMVRYRLRSGHEVKAYFQWPWEDGSGIGRRNGWDGLWGLEWKSADAQAPVSGAVVEYIDMTNQSGPQHYAPGDHPGTSITTESTGADDYYNNFMYNSYAHYGMSIGTPMLMAPIFNLDGYPAYVANRMRGFHIALEGHITPEIAWRAMGGYRVGYGNGMQILPENIHDTSVAVDVRWSVPQISGLSLGGQLALDHGTMPGNSFGALVTLSYQGLLKL